MCMSAMGYAGEKRVMTPLRNHSPEQLSVGCNYWASHAGSAMWSDWRSDVVEDDFRHLALSGIRVVRVFPLWPDFQPLTRLAGERGTPIEYRLGEAPLADDDAGRAGVATIAIERFSALVDSAERHNIKLIVGLITGWMSGRLFVPPALTGLNVLTDPIALMWQVRFVHYFVHFFRERETITAWDLGNECNVMGEVTTREQAWHWTATITNAIRAVDTRPIISGMHSLAPAGHWTIQDQGELTDVLTTHPYPLWTPYCDQDSLTTLRPLLHAAAESRLYSDLSGRPCLVEETGTMGPMIINDAGAADFLRASLFSLWAHGCTGLLWWCAFDQEHLAHAPYDWNAVERELGLFQADHTPKPAVTEIAAFTAFQEQAGVLPPTQCDAVCILTEDQDHWAVAYSTFILSKQAGIDVAFHYVDGPIPEAKLYFLPSIRGTKVLARRHELLTQVHAGATLYISYDGGFLSQFANVTGLEVNGRALRHTDATTFGVNGASTTMTGLRGSYMLDLKPLHAEVLASEVDGRPLLTWCARPLEVLPHSCTAAPAWADRHQTGATIGRD